MIYVTDVGQAMHFEMVFAAARMAGWLPKEEDAFPRVSHVGFGLVMGERRALGGLPPPAADTRAAAGPPALGRPCLPALHP